MLLVIFYTKAQKFILKFKKTDLDIYSKPGCRFQRFMTPSRNETKKHIEFFLFQEYGNFIDP